MRDCCGRRCALCTFATTTLVGCFMGDSNVVDASSDDGGTEADTTVEASSCTSSLGTLVGAETDFPIGTWKLVPSKLFRHLHRRARRGRILRLLRDLYASGLHRRRAQ